MTKKQRSDFNWFTGPLLRLLTVALLAVFGAGTAAAQTLAYVSEGLAGVQVLDTATNTVVATVPIGGEPGDLAATPNGAFVYVVNVSGNSVSVIAVATNTVIATIAVAQPVNIAFTPDSAFAYVTSSALNSQNVSELYVIDTAKLKVVQKIPIDQNLTGVAVTPDGKSVWVSSVETSDVYVINTATYTVSATIGVASHITGLAITPDGAFVYVASLDGTVEVISTATNALVASIPNQPAVDVAVTPNGAFAYVPNPFSVSVAVIDTATNAVVAIVPIAGNPAFVAITPNGAFAYVADLDGQVWVIDTATNTVADSVPVGLSLRGIDILIKPPSPTTKQQCKNGGWATFSSPSFANQGTCISYVNKL
jgi:YVTN family beta-propeller protein